MSGDADLLFIIGSGDESDQIAQRGTRIIVCTSLATISARTARPISRAIAYWSI